MLARTQHLIEQLQGRLHPDYLRGFRELILPWKTIPRLSEINLTLRRFGWEAVCVEGYIPPDAYAGLLQRGYFPVSRSIRGPEHVDFSPAPDMAHDLLGHLPMLISPDHGKFLRRLAAAMSAVHGNALDRELYFANRTLAAARCRPGCSPAQRQSAERRVELLHEALARLPSALTELGRLFLWTIEFGLMGSARDFRIYGAGLISSTAETRALCLGGVPVQTLSLSAVERDIHFSDLQSSYFVAPDFGFLNRLLTRLQRKWSRSLERERGRRANTRLEAIS